MENDKVRHEDFNPYVDKKVAKNDLLLKILLFLFFIGISLFSTYLRDKPESITMQVLLNMLYSTLGTISVIAIIGYLIAYAFTRKKSKKERNKYWLICSIIVSLVFLITDILSKSNEVGISKNNVVTEQMSNKFYSEEGKYSISFPGIPKSEKNEIDNPSFGKIVIKINKVVNDKVVFYATFMDVDELLNWGKEQIEQHLISMKDNSIKGLRGQLLSSKLFKFISSSKSDGLGIDYSGEYETGLVYGRIINIKNRIYHILVVTEKNVTPQVEIDKFINSFYSDY